MNDVEQHRSLMMGNKQRHKSEVSDVFEHMVLKVVIFILFDREV